MECASRGAAHDGSFARCRRDPRRLRCCRRVVRSGTRGLAGNTHSTLNGRTHKQKRTQTQSTYSKHTHIYLRLYPERVPGPIIILLIIMFFL